MMSHEDLEYREPGKDDVMEAAVFGDRVHLFLNSDIGQYLIGRADYEISEGLKALKDANPEDPKEIRAIQNRIKVGESFKSWLQEAIQVGLEALGILEDEERENV